MRARGVVAILVCVWTAPACWPGRCEGAVRGAWPDNARLRLNLDTNVANGDEILAASQLSARSVLLEGPAGMVPLVVEASVHKTAHSCASRGSFYATATTPLAPGDYTFIVLMDQVKWPAINDEDVTTWQGHPAIVRRTHVP